MHQLKHKLKNQTKLYIQKICKSYLSVEMFRIKKAKNLLKEFSSRSNNDAEDKLNQSKIGIVNSIFYIIYYVC